MSIIDDEFFKTRQRVPMFIGSRISDRCLQSGQSTSKKLQKKWAFLCPLSLKKVVARQPTMAQSGDALLSCLASIASDPHSPEEEQVNNF